MAFLHSDLFSVQFLLSDFIQPPWLHWLLPTSLMSSRTVLRQSLPGPGLQPFSPAPTMPFPCRHLADRWCSNLGKASWIQQKGCRFQVGRAACCGTMGCWNQASPGAPVLEWFNNKAARDSPQPLASPPFLTFQAAFSLTPSH